MRLEKFGSQLDRKSKTCFFIFLMCIFPELNETKFWSHSFHLKHLGILQTRMDQMGRTPPHENILDSTY